MHQYPHFRNFSRHSYLEKLVDIESHIVIDEFRVQTPKVGVVDVLEYQGRCLALAIPHHI